jgi:hypothetical protein
MLVANIEQQVALLLGQLSGAPPVTARLRTQCLESAFLVEIQPAFERRKRVLPADFGAGWPVVFLAQPRQFRAQLSMIEIAAREHANDFATE